MISMPQIFCLLIFAICAATDDSIKKKIIGLRKLLAKRCVNGELNDVGRCICTEDFVGRHCEKRKMCETYRRYRNGTCVSCEYGYSGSFCDNIVCENGVKDASGLNCICDKPFNGKFCNELLTTNVLSYYNNRVYDWGPIGGFSLIPMVLILYFCEKFAHKRRVTRVSAQWGTNVEEKTLSKFLKAENV